MKYFEKAEVDIIDIEAIDIVCTSCTTDGCSTYTFGCGEDEEIL